MKKLILLVSIAVIVAIGVVINTNSVIQAEYWEAPESNGVSQRLVNKAQLLPLSLIELGKYSGPEDITVNQQNELFVSTAEGYILKLNVMTNQLVEWVFTGGYPLGLRFDNAHNLIIADAALGLLKVDQQQQITVLADQFDGSPLGFVDALDIDDKGIIYFSDASRKFSPRDYGGPENASEIDIFEHGGNGRIYAYDPQTKTLELLLDNLQFANGVSLTHDQQALLIVETANYRILKYYLHGDRQGEVSVVLGNLPGFPDNIVRHPKTGYWLGLTAPRSSALDKLSRWPLIRQMVYQLPKSLKPSAQNYGHVLHIDDNGQVITSLTDPSGSYPMTTGAMQHQNHLYISSLKGQVIGVKQLGDLETHEGQIPNGEY